MAAFKRTLTFFFILSIFSQPGLFAQENNPLLTEDLENQKQWVDSIYQQMTLKEKVGQVFMVDIISSQPASKTDKIKELIEEHHLGGVVFSKGGPVRQAELTNEYQQLSKVPLLIGMDAEMELAMHPDSTFAFPRKMALGAIQDLQLIEETGAAIAKNARRLGAHLKFAPVVDIKANPEDPIIGNPSFGEDKKKLSEKAVAFLKGMNRENVLATPRHFPEHGDADMDSHKELQLEQDYRGLIFTDALAMKGANISETGENSVAAFLAGNDVLLMPADISRATAALMNAYRTEVISEERLQHSVKKILYAKYKVGLNNYRPVNTTFLYEDLNSIRNRALNEKLVENSLTLIKNDQGILPVRNLDQKRIAYLEFGDADATAFHNQLSKYAQVDKVEAEHLSELLQKLEAYNLVIVGFHKSNASPYASYKFTNKELVWLYEIARTNNVILNVFTSPYALLDLESNANFKGILVGYQNNEIFQEKAAQLIFGALEAKGTLPVAAGSKFPVGTGFKTEHLQRLSYGLPENVGMNSYKLRKIDSLIDETIQKKMSPGVQVLIARKGKVIYNRSAGYHTYKKKIPVSDSDVYDLASLTKILGTLPLVMELVDQNELDLDTKIAQMLPLFETSNKKETNLRQMLSHYAKLKPWIPFHRYTFDQTTKGPSADYYRTESIGEYNTKVADGFYIRNDIRDSIINIIHESDLQRKLEYRYSDLPYYLLKRYLENRYNASLATIVEDHFYTSLGATNTTYLPLNKFPKEKIVPTENDKTWRKQLLHGYVHDEGAALLGGIGGHAGLFSNANDVAKMMQMYLNGGAYGGKTYFERETFDKFNTCYYCQADVRRGIGFDKPQLSGGGPTCGCVSMSSFGHSGFTGTFTWADPNEEIVYVFLSNRIHPSVDNNKLTREGIRSKIQEAIYEAIDY